jgi:acyl carrier protein
LELAELSGKIFSMSDELNLEIKKMLVENLMLQAAPEEIGDDQLLFGPNSLGLDSVDALQIVVALEKNYGVKISDPQAAKKTLQTVSNIAAAIRENQSKK